MIRTTLLNPWNTAISTIRSKINLLTWQELAFAVVGGVAIAVVGKFLGRTLHLIWPVPMSGSLAAALPRTIISLMILLRTKRFGMLTIAGVTEVSTGLSIGFIGWLPMSLLVPLLTGVAGDLIWRQLKKLPSRKIALVLAGGGICGARMLIALFFWTILSRPIFTAPEYLAIILGGIVIANIILGMLAGLVVGKSVATKINGNDR